MFCPKYDDIVRTCTKSNVLKRFKAGKMEN